MQVQEHIWRDPIYARPVKHDVDSILFLYFSGQYLTRNLYAMATAQATK